METLDGIRSMFCCVSLYLRITAQDLSAILSIDQVEQAFLPAFMLQHRNVKAVQSSLFVSFHDPVHNFLTIFSSLYEMLHSVYQEILLSEV